jgi:Ubiquitin binding region
MYFLCFCLITCVFYLFSCRSLDVVLPEGVDPSFLAALPENIRQEVIAEQLRLQRIQQRAQQVQQEAQSLGTTEVNPEFLAALPPHIQEEVSQPNQLINVSTD